jgi:hypothetical protein
VDSSESNSGRVFACLCSLSNSGHFFSLTVCIELCSLSNSGRIFACLCSLSNSERIFACFDIVDSSDTNSGRIFACFDVVDSS